MTLLKLQIASAFIASAGLIAPLAAQKVASVPVTISVIDQTGAVIPGAHIRVIPAPAPQPATLETDSRGEISLLLTPGGHALFVAAQGFFSNVRHIEVVATTPAQKIPVMLSVASYSGPIVVSEESTQGDLQLSALPYHNDWMISLGELKAMPRTTAVNRNPETNRDETYAGVRLASLLTAAGAPMGKEMYGEALTTYLFARGYRPGVKQMAEVVFSLAEIDAASPQAEILIADSINGRPLDAISGPLLLVVSSDKRRVRWVGNLKSISVQTQGYPSRH